MGGKEGKETERIEMEEREWKMRREDEVRENF